jgi:hypothetical protein
MRSCEHLERLADRPFGTPIAGGRAKRETRLLNDVLNLPASKLDCGDKIAESYDQNAEHYYNRCASLFRGTLAANCSSH